LSGAQQIAFDAVGRNAILADTHFKEGRYYGEASPDRGLAIARMLAHITYLSDQSMQTKFGRSLRTADKFQYDFDSEFAVETYLDYQGAQFVNRFDANTYLYVTKAMDYFDIAAQYGTLDDAMARVKCKMLVLAYSSDWLYPPYLSEMVVYALARQNKDVTYCNVQSDYGHDAFLLEVEVMDQIISGFLGHTYAPISQVPVLPPPTQGEGSNSTDDQSIYSGRRVDYDMIENLVDERAKVLDIGCGDGELLSRLVESKGVHATGLELAQENIVACTQRGISVIQADIDQGLSAFPDQSFDYIILSMTLQVIQNPELALQEMLRVGRKCIVSFPNFGHWRVRAQVLFSGRAPVTRNLPYAWNRTPNRHVLSVRDFREFCKNLDIRIEREVPLASEGVVSFQPNLLAEEALYVIASK
jgi:homoserine O-acetyltransferase